MFSAAYSDRVRFITQGLRQHDLFIDMEAPGAIHESLGLRQAEYALNL
jgi:hypothetical protein